MSQTLKINGTLGAVLKVAAKQSPKAAKKSRKKAAKNAQIAKK